MRLRSWRRGEEAVDKHGEIEGYLAKVEERALGVVRDLFIAVRDNEMRPTDRGVDLILKTVDLVRQLSRPEGPKAQAEKPAVAQAVKAADREAPQLSKKYVEPVRVSSEKLDDLLELAGEIAVTFYGLKGNPKDKGGSSNTHAALGKLVRQLQEAALGLRLVPLNSLFTRMSRLVRETAAKTGKKVRFVASGEETEIDKLVAERLSETLIHLLRNSIDHGLETAGERGAAGKQETGVVSLSAYHKSGKAVLEVSDDGKGLDPEKILAKALDCGLADPNRAYTDRELFDFLFEAGFSLAKEVTELSGRGVGMDAVRQVVRELGGEIEVESRKGAGSTFRLTLPLAAAVTDGILVKVGGSRYVLPLGAVREFLCGDEAEVINIHDRGEAVMLRGEVLPITRLEHITCEAAAFNDYRSSAFVVIAAGGKTAAVRVDNLGGCVQLVTKPIPEFTSRLAGSCAVLGDGRPVLVLNVEALTDGTGLNGQLCRTGNTQMF